MCNKETVAMFMRELAEKNDVETAYFKGVELLCAVLIEEGFTELVKEFKKID
jgi:hypothetical protein